MISGAARVLGLAGDARADGGYGIRHVTGPDEENPDVNGEVYTEVGARTTLRDAIAAAKLVGAPRPRAGRGSRAVCASPSPTGSTPSSTATAVSWSSRPT